MKKLSVSIILLFLLLLTTFSNFLPPVWAQVEFDFERAYQDYIYHYNQYLEAHKEYLIAKNQYETYQTLISKTIALEQTTVMLQARDEVVATFLAAFRTKLADETNVASGTLNLLYLQLDEEAHWFRNHKETLTSAGSIPDLLKLSDQAQKRYQKTQALVYQSLLEIFLYQEDLLHQKLQDQINQIEAKIIEIRSRGDKNTSAIERWLLEAKNRKVRSNEKLIQAKSYKINEKASSGQNRRVFNKTVSVIEQSHQYLKETNIALLEIIKEVKIGD